MNWPRLVTSLIATVGLGLAVRAVWFWWQDR